jgi:superfamily II DNA or RNA helicase
MPFGAGIQVRDKNDPSRIGMVASLGPRHAGQQYYNVFWGGQGTRTVGESDLLEFVETTTPIDSLRSGLLSGYAEFQRLMTLQRLVRDQPLRNNLYSFNASRTQFYPYQFKPLLKFLDSSNNRILICDEVGLGKTIEAGLLLLELRARQTIRTVLVICPSNLRHKWRLELKQRFGEDFRILQARDFKQFLSDYEENPDRTTLNGIVSLETMRTSQIRERLEELSVPIDFVIIDEAHHLRNFGTSQREAGRLITEYANSVAMLTATPVHLGQENLFSLLNLLDPEDFPDAESAVERFRDNENVVHAQRLLAAHVPDFAEAAQYLDAASQSRWTTRKDLLRAVCDKLRAAGDANHSDSERRAFLISLQRDLSDLNLLGHILTRTRKRDVLEQVVVRRAQSILITFNERERALYEGVTNSVKEAGRKAGDNEGVLAWRLNTPQRRLASSIQGMVDFYRQSKTWTKDDNDENELLDDEEPTDEVARDIQADVSSLIANWPSNAPDSKYDELVSLLGELPLSGRRQKVLIFATFKHTIRYLDRRLKADGIGVVAISGDTPIDERPAIINRFREDAGITVLVSSRVGAEGLDFQFCSVLVNYDLPWNPMEVEQRIGRLDRIGQQADSIAIFNFWTQDTIEERILRRLYERIGIFERSIGDLEAILGELGSRIQNELVRANLDPDEIDRRVEQIARAVEQRRSSLEVLESSAASFVGVDSFFDDEVDAIRTKRRYVTGEQLYHFLYDFLVNHAPRTRLDYDHETKLGILIPEEALRQFLRQSGRAGEALMIAGSVGSPVQITFDSQTAFKMPGVEFLNVLHPLIAAIADHYVTNPVAPAAQHVVLRTDTIEEGFYFFFVYKIKVNSAKAASFLETVIVSPDGPTIVESADTERLLGEMVEKGESPTDPIEIEPQVADISIRKAELELIQRLSAIKSAELTANEAFVDQRVASLRAFYEKGIRKKKDLLERGLAAQRQQRYVAMMKGQVARLETALHDKERELSSLRNVTAEYSNVAAGVLEVAAVKNTNNS